MEASHSCVGMASLRNRTGQCYRKLSDGARRFDVIMRVVVLCCQKRYLIFLLRRDPKNGNTPVIESLPKHIPIYMVFERPHPDLPRYHVHSFRRMVHTVHRDDVICFVYRDIASPGPTRDELSRQFYLENEPIRSGIFIFMVTFRKREGRRSSKRLSTTSGTTRSAYSFFFRSSTLLLNVPTVVFSSV